MLTENVRRRAYELVSDGGLPAFVYDLGALRRHVAAIREALTGGPEIFYAAKANPDARILTTVAPYVDGVEVASGGELEHVRRVLPQARLAFGGPGKTDDELALAVREAERIHVESPYELSRLASLRRKVNVLLRVNLAGERKGVALTMSGPFGMDPSSMEECRDILANAPWVRLRGIHAHLASGLDADAMLRQSEEILRWARPWLKQTEAPEFNLGGGMAVDYSNPSRRFDWTAYGRQVAALAEPGETLRIEPGRAMTVYAGWYVTQVMDVKKTHGQWYAVLRGGTHHIRTPATKNHNQPFTVLPHGTHTPHMQNAPVTLVGQLCTPKDVLAHQAPVTHLAIDDVVAFSMAGAYAWNISHHNFLMHPNPSFHYV